MQSIPDENLLYVNKYRYPDQESLKRSLKRKHEELSNGKTQTEAQIKKHCRDMKNNSILTKCNQGAKTVLVNQETLEKLVTGKEFDQFENRPQEDDVELLSLDVQEKPKDVSGKKNDLNEEVTYDKSSQELYNSTSYDIVETQEYCSDTESEVFDDLFFKYSIQDVEEMCEGSISPTFDCTLYLEHSAKSSKQEGAKLHCSQTQEQGMSSGEIDPESSEEVVRKVSTDSVSRVDSNIKTLEKDEAILHCRETRDNTVEQDTSGKEICQDVEETVSKDFSGNRSKLGEIVKDLEQDETMLHCSGNHNSNVGQGITVTGIQSSHLEQDVLLSKEVHESSVQIVCKDSGDIMKMVDNDANLNKSDYTTLATISESEGSHGQDAEAFLQRDSLPSSTVVCPNMKCRPQEVVEKSINCTSETNSKINDETSIREVSINKESGIESKEGFVRSFSSNEVRTLISEDVESKGEASQNVFSVSEVLQQVSEDKNCKEEASGQIAINVNEAIDLIRENCKHSVKKSVKLFEAMVNVDDASSESKEELSSRTNKRNAEAITNKENGSAFELLSEVLETVDKELQKNTVEGSSGYYQTFNVEVKSHCKDTSIAEENGVRSSTYNKLHSQVLASKMAVRPSLPLNVVKNSAKPSDVCGLKVGVSSNIDFDKSFERQTFKIAVPDESESVESEQELSTRVTTETVSKTPEIDEIVEMSKTLEVEEEVDKTSEEIGQVLIESEEGRSQLGDTETSEIDSEESKKFTEYEQNSEIRVGDYECESLEPGEEEGERLIELPMELEETNFEIEASESSEMERVGEKSSKLTESHSEQVSETARVDNQSEKFESEKEKVSRKFKKVDIPSIASEEADFEVEVCQSAENKNELENLESEEISQSSEGVSNLSIASGKTHWKMDDRKTFEVENKSGESKRLRETLQGSEFIETECKSLVLEEDPFSKSKEADFKVDAMKNSEIEKESMKLTESELKLIPEVEEVEDESKDSEKVSKISEEVDKPSTETEEMECEVGESWKITESQSDQSLKNGRTGNDSDNVRSEEEEVGHISQEVEQLSIASAEVNFKLQSSLSADSEDTEEHGEFEKLESEEVSQISGEIDISSIVSAKTDFEDQNSKSSPIESEESKKCVGSEESSEIRRADNLSENFKLPEEEVNQSYEGLDELPKESEEQKSEFKVSDMSEATKLESNIDNGKIFKGQGESKKDFKQSEIEAAKTCETDVTMKSRKSVPDTCDERDIEKTILKMVEDADLDNGSPLSMSDISMSKEIEPGTLQNSAMELKKTIEAEPMPEARSELARQGSTIKNEMAPASSYHGLETSAESESTKNDKMLVSIDEKPCVEDKTSAEDKSSFDLGKTSRSENELSLTQNEPACVHHEPSAAQDKTSPVEDEPSCVQKETLHELQEKAGVEEKNCEREVNLNMSIEASVIGRNHAESKEMSLDSETSFVVEKNLGNESKLYSSGEIDFGDSETTAVFSKLLKSNQSRSVKHLLRDILKKNLEISSNLKMVSKNSSKVLLKEDQFQDTLASNHHVIESGSLEQSYVQDLITRADLLGDLEWDKTSGNYGKKALNSSESRERGSPSVNEFVQKKKNSGSIVHRVSARLSAKELGKKRKNDDPWRKLRKCGRNYSDVRSTRRKSERQPARRKRRFFYTPSSNLCSREIPYISREETSSKLQSEEKKNSDRNVKDNRKDNARSSRCFMEEDESVVKEKEEVPEDDKQSCMSDDDDDFRLHLSSLDEDTTSNSPIKTFTTSANVDMSSPDPNETCSKKDKSETNDLCLCDSLHGEISTLLATCTEPNETRVARDRAITDERSMVRSASEDPASKITFENIHTPANGASALSSPKSLVRSTSKDFKGPSTGSAADKSHCSKISTTSISPGKSCPFLILQNDNSSSSEENFGSLRLNTICSSLASSFGEDEFNKLASTAPTASSLGETDSTPLQRNSNSSMSTIEFLEALSRQNSQEEKSMEWEENHGPIHSRDISEVSMDSDTGGSMACPSKRGLSSNYGLRSSRTRKKKGRSGIFPETQAKKRRMTATDLASGTQSPKSLLNLTKRPLEEYINSMEKVYRTSGKKSKTGRLAIAMNDHASKSNSRGSEGDFLQLGDMEVMYEMVNKAYGESQLKRCRPTPRSLYLAAKQGNVHQVLVLAAGCNVNATIPQERHKTAMHAAAAGGHVDVLRILCMVGGNLSPLDTKLQTPLFDAVENQQTEAVKFLISQNVNVNLKDSQGVTVLHVAAQKSNVDMINLLMETRKLDINEQDSGGWTALMWTAESRRVDVARCLLRWGADVNILDNEQNTCLHWAALSGDTEIMELLLEANVHIDARNIFGATALHISARERKLLNLRILAKYRPNLEIINADGKKALELVRCNSKCYLQLKEMEMLTSLAKYTLKERLITRDVARGQERRPIPCINDVDEEMLPNDFVYISNNLECQSKSFCRTMTGCNCSYSCVNAKVCDCAQLSDGKRFWYNETGRISQEIFEEDRPVVFECNMKCKCWSTCHQRVVQRGITAGLQLYKTLDKGWAVRTQALIPKGTFVCEYVGEILTDKEANEREDDCYLFDLDVKGQSTLFCLDAKFYGNVTRFINHSCDPNILPVRVFTDHQVKSCPRIAFFAARDIKPYEEVCSNYGEKFWTVKKSEFKCVCKTSKCKYGALTVSNEQSN